MILMPVLQVELVVVAYQAAARYSFACHVLG